MSFYFSKYFGQYGLNNVDYWLCPKCGFVASKTHFDLPQDAWESLNLEFHLAHNSREDNPYNRHQRIFNQAQMLHLLMQHGILPDKLWLDWGSGEGDLAIQLDNHFGLTLENFDKYINPKITPVSESELTNRRAAFNLVINTGVFEHILSRQTLDEIESYVADMGALAIHTLVRDQIPNDPEWMYLLPVHTAFHTNKSMQVLMDSWGYKCSVYNEQAKLWVLFRQKPGNIQPLIQRLNTIMGWEYLHYKEGFMDYWR
jgi:hypothetical protein